MPNTREKLIELLKDGGVRDFPFNAALADHLTANGVTVLTEDEQRNIYTVQEIEELENEAYDLGVESALKNKYGLSWQEAKEKREALWAAGKWIPVTERLPEGFKHVLVFRNGNIAIDYHEEDGWFAHDFSGKRVTHWMPLPEPPKEV